MNKLTWTIACIESQKHIHILHLNTNIKRNTSIKKTIFNKQITCSINKVPFEGREREEKNLSHRHGTDATSRRRLPGKMLDHNVLIVTRNSVVVLGLYHVHKRLFRTYTIYGTEGSCLTIYVVKFCAGIIQNTLRNINERMGSVIHSILKYPINISAG